MMLDAKQSSLAQLLIGIFLVGLPYLPRLPFLTLILVALLTIWNLAIVLRKVNTPRTWIRVLLLILVIVVMLASHGSLLGRNAGTSFLVLLMYMKLFENKTQRDAFIIIFMGFFLIASNFFFTQDPWTAPYVFVSTIYLTSLMIVFSDKMAATRFRQRLRVAGRMIFQATPLMLILFVLFPRIPGPLWGLPKDAVSATTGLSEEMSPGSLSNLTLSNEVAFRVRFEEQPPPHNNLYWRGPVLANYDGQKWTANPSLVRAEPNLEYSDSVDNHIRYTVTLQPHQKQWLFALEHPLASPDAEYRLSRELQLFNRRKITSVFQYTMVSDSAAQDLSMFYWEREKNLQLPDNLNEKTRELAQKWLDESNDDHLVVIDKALKYFNQQPFSYTLNPALLGNDAMDDFLFETRQGFCEHYSSAFVYLMRAAGIPARVVTGYQGGEINPVDNYMIVRQSSAHAWAEVWLEDKGWVRYDPTAAVSPSRVESGIQDAVSERDQLPAILITNNQVLRMLQYRWDSFNTAWTEWVIGFNRKKQMLLFKNLGFPDVTWQDLALWMGILMALLTGIIAFLIIRQANTANLDAIKLNYEHFCRKMKKLGMNRLPHEGAIEFQSRINKTHPGLSRVTTRITNMYLKLRYGTGVSKQDNIEFTRSVKRFNAKAV